MRIDRIAQFVAAGCVRPADAVPRQRRQSIEAPSTVTGAHPCSCQIVAHHPCFTVCACLCVLCACCSATARPLVDKSDAGPAPQLPFRTLCFSSKHQLVSDWLCYSACCAVQQFLLLLLLLLLLLRRTVRTRTTPRRPAVHQLTLPCVVNGEKALSFVVLDAPIAQDSHR